MRLNVFVLGGDYPGHPVHQVPTASGNVTMCIIGGKEHTTCGDALMRETLRATGLKTQREAVEAGLRMLLRLSQQSEIRRARGKLKWTANLDEMRSDR